MAPSLTALLIAIASLLISALAEYWHVLRSRAMGHLEFGPAGRPRSWTVCVPLMRVLAAGLLAWGLTVLVLSEPGLLASNRGSGGNEETEPDDLQRVILVLDVSPSMNAEDAGSDGKVRRRDRVLDLKQAMVAVV